MRYAVVKEGVVENVIEWDGTEMLTGLAGADFIRSDTAGVGDKYENGEFISSAPVLTEEEIAALEAAAEEWKQNETVEPTEQQEEEVE